MGGEGLLTGLPRLLTPGWDNGTIPAVSPVLRWAGVVGEFRWLTSRLIRCLEARANPVVRSGRNLCAKKKVNKKPLPGSSTIALNTPK